MAVLKSGGVVPIVDDKGRCRIWPSIRQAREDMDRLEEELKKSHDLKRWHVVGIPDEVEF